MFYSNTFKSGVLLLIVSLLTACGGSSGTSASATAPAITLSSIAITPVSAIIAKGLTSSLTATGTYSDASTADITSQVVWTSADPAIASMGTQPGVVSGTAVGTTSVTATLSGVTSPAAGITVIAATLTGIAVTPGSASIAKGNSATFTATGMYSDGSNGNISGTVTWHSSNTAVATLNTSGIATGTATGTSSITAALNGITSSAATLTVTAPVVQSISITPSAPSVMATSTVNLTATEVYSDASTTDITATATWSSANTGIATVGLHTGVATGVATGSTTITAASSGLTSAPVTLSVTAFVPPTCTWDVTTWDNCLWGN